MRGKGKAVFLRLARPSRGVRYQCHYNAIVNKVKRKILPSVKILLMRAKRNGSLWHWQARDGYSMIDGAGQLHRLAKEPDACLPPMPENVSR